MHLLSVRAILGMRDRGYSSYCSSKGGLALLVKQHAVELARHGIVFNDTLGCAIRATFFIDKRGTLVDEFRTDGLGVARESSRYREAFAKLA